MDYPDFEARQIALQFYAARRANLIQRDIVFEQSYDVRPTEEAAMRLIHTHTRLLLPSRGFMTPKYRFGARNRVWTELNHKHKNRICHEIWDLVAQIRTVPRPPSPPEDIYATADACPSRDPPLGGNADLSPLAMDDCALRRRIVSRYFVFGGDSYRDDFDLFDILLQFRVSVFAHGDHCPWNVMMDEQYQITAVLDWESSGWSPDWWKYYQMMNVCTPEEREWENMKWMDRTKPQPWDISGIGKASRILF
ncbi:hypothetical protein ACCO45_010672 [Purpureocillium lilacinum]|uniref:Uncharacterized protein n=1 Tax=Purpureocillium lilacinum TaxID=33203 RepID=A0ACC4DHT0_PURLI